MTGQTPLDNTGAGGSPLIELWKSVVLRTGERFNLDIGFVDRETAVEASEGSAWPESFDERVIVSDESVRVPDISMTSAPLVGAIMTRESLRHMLSQATFDQRAAFDLSCEYARQTLDGANTTAWEKEWSRRSPQTVSRLGAAYSPVPMFDALFRLSGKEGLNDLVTRVMKLAGHGISVRFEDWMGYAFRFIQDYAHPLTQLEVRILDSLLNEPELSREHLSARLRVSSDWVGKTIQGLQERGQLKEYEYLSFAALGIRVLQTLLIPSSESRVRCEDLLNDCPFVYSVHRILMGHGGVFATLCIPDNTHNMDHVKRMVKAARHCGLTVHMHERIKSRPLYNLRSYEHTTQTWNVDWSGLQLEAEMTYGGILESPTDSLMPDAPARLCECDTLDAHLLAEIQRGKTTVKELQRAVRRRTAVVIERLNRLRAAGVVKHFWEIHHLGLINDLVVVSLDDASAMVLSSVARHLPKSFVDVTDNGRVLLRCQLPVGGAVSLARATSFMDPIPVVHVLDTRTYGGWDLSRFIPDWNSYKGSWAAHEGARLDKWAQRIDRL